MIPKFDIKYTENDIQVFIESARKIFNRAFLTNDEFVSELESKFAKKNESLHGLAVCNGTGAIEMALRTIGVKDKYVVVPSVTFIATALAVLRAGGIPLILDVDKDYFGLSPDQLEHSIKKYSGKIGAICHVHIGGHISPNFMNVLGLARKFNIKLVEDACQAVGASFNDTFAGNFGDFGAYSLSLTKSMTCGEGGLVVTGSLSSYTTLKSLRVFGQSIDNPLLFDKESSNFKMSELNAALALIDLSRLEGRTAQRRNLAKRYQENLAGSQFKCIKDSQRSKGSYYKQIIIPVDIERRNIEEVFANNNIQLTGGVYYYPLHRQPILKKYINNNNYPVSEYFSQKHFCPPCFPEIGVDEVDEVCEVLLAIG